MENSKASISELFAAAERMISDSLYDEAMTDLRKIVHYMAKWILYETHHWEEASIDKNGKRVRDPSLNHCIFLLTRYRLMDKADRIMFEMIQSVGNTGAHEVGVSVHTANKCLEDLRNYYGKFRMEYPVATGLDVTPWTAEKAEVYGCDIGNGYAFISLLKDPQEDPIVMLPAVNHLSSIGMPVTAYPVPPEGKEILVNELASRRNVNPDLLIRAIKTKLKEGLVSVPGIPNKIRASSVYAAIARDLIKLANTEREQRGESSVYNVVFTFPSAFNRNYEVLNEMQKSIEETELDGNHIHVVGRLPEPAAAAIDYLYYMQNIVPEDLKIKRNEMTALVYDLGHGSFDAAVVTARSSGKKYEMHLDAGLEDVGGIRFDELLCGEIERVLKEEWAYEAKDPVERELIRSAAVSIKHQLTDTDIASEMIYLQDKGQYAEVAISRDRFEEISADLLQKTLDLVRNLTEEAREKEIRIDAVVLSGAASKMPMVMKHLKELYDPEGIPVVLYRPSSAVSFGASRFAYNLASVRKKAKGRKKSEVSGKIPVGDEAPSVLNQYTKYDYGVFGAGEDLYGTVKAIINTGQKLPATSDCLMFHACSPKVNLRILRADPSEKNALGMSNELIRIPFDVEPDRNYEAVITVEEDYNVSVSLMEEGKEIAVKNTGDYVEELY